MKSTSTLLAEMEAICDRLGKQGWTDEGAATVAAAAVLGHILSGIEASLDNIHNSM